jgi:hypothetical protein
MEKRKIGSEAVQNKTLSGAASLKKSDGILDEG